MSRLAVAVAFGGLSCALSAGCGDILGYQEVSYRTEPSPDTEVVSSEGGADARGSQSDASSADAEASQDPEEPDPPPTSCMAESPAGTCHIDCSGSRCEGKRIMCPQGRPCVVRCSEAGCGWIGCPKDHPCTVECVGGSACQDLVLRGNVASKLCLRCMMPVASHVVCDRLTVGLPAGGRSTCALYCESPASCGSEMGPMGDVGVCRREDCVPS